MTDAPATYGAPPRRDWILLAMLSAVPLIVELAGLLSKDYGYFIDEFYYIACSKRLAFGYVDHPPLAPWVLAATRPVLGDALWAIRVPAYLATSATVWVTGLVVWRLGGARFATVLAGLTVGLSPVLLAMGSFYSMNAFEPLLWALIVLTVVQIIQTGRSRLWLVAGALVGLAFQNKHTVIVYLAALAAGVLATRTRRMLLDRWLWAGAAVAVVLAVPNVV
jgi:4-amino-4-deoxy-L-arabinose transferase-like glycosyltransferase